MGFEKFQEEIHGKERWGMGVLGVELTDWLKTPQIDWDRDWWQQWPFSWKRLGFRLFMTFILTGSYSRTFHHLIIIIISNVMRKQSIKRERIKTKTQLNSKSSFECKENWRAHFWMLLSAFRKRVSTTFLLPYGSRPWNVRTGINFFF